MSGCIDLSPEDLQIILDEHIQPPRKIDGVTELSSNTSAFSKAFLLHCGKDSDAYLLRATKSETDERSLFSPNTLHAQKTIIDSLISRSPPPLPLPKPIALGTSKSTVPYPYILLSIPSLTGSRLTTLADARTTLSQAQYLKTDIRLGSYFHQLHEIQNDWFGTPAQEKDGIWSWQEAFTLLLENILSHVEAHQEELGISLPMVEIRQYLSRAIGFFLFDDCEVPSLVSLTDDESTILVEEPPQGSEDEPNMAAFVGWEYGLWGDPMMETLLREPSDALIEGYGGPIVLFPRQRTKQLWYALYAGLLTILEGRGGVNAVQSAKELVVKCVERLKDAPIY